MGSRRLSAECEAGGGRDLAKWEPGARPAGAPRAPAAPWVYFLNGPGWPGSRARDLTP